MKNSRQDQQKNKAPTHGLFFAFLHLAPELQGRGAKGQKSNRKKKRLSMFIEPSGHPRGIANCKKQLFILMEVNLNVKSKMTR
jgi:hypothetical protein